MLGGAQTLKMATPAAAWKYMKRGGHKALIKGKAFYNFIPGSGKGGFATKAGAAALPSAIGGAIAGQAVAMGTKIAANKIQQGVAKRRVAKYGQQGSAIIPNKKITGGTGVGDVMREGARLYRGEKTYTHDTPGKSRKAARHYRKKVKGKAYKQHAIEGLTKKEYKNKPKNTLVASKSKEIGLTGASKRKDIYWNPSSLQAGILNQQGGSTFKKTKTRLGGKTVTKTRKITNKRAARYANRYNK